MSFFAKQWALYQWSSGPDLTPGAKLVFMVIADKAQESDLTFSSESHSRDTVFSYEWDTTVSRVCDLVRLSRTAVTRVLDELESVGLLHRSRFDRSHLSKFAIPIPASFVNYQRKLTGNKREPQDSARWAKPTAGEQVRQARAAQRQREQGGAAHE